MEIFSLKSPGIVAWTTDLEGQMHTWRNFRYIKLIHGTKNLLMMDWATPYKWAKWHLEKPLLRGHNTIQNSSTGLSFCGHPFFAGVMCNVFFLLSGPPYLHSVYEIIIWNSYSMFTWISATAFIKLFCASSAALNPGRRFLEGALLVEGNAY